MNIIELPDEVLFHIFSYFSVVELSRITRTCTTFYKICHDPLLWNNIDLEVLKKSLTDSQSENFLNYKKQLVQQASKISLRGCQKLSKQAMVNFSAVIGNTSYLKELNLLSVELKDTVLSNLFDQLTNIHSLSIGPLTIKGDCLEHLNTSALQHITLFTCNKIEKPKLLAFFKRLPPSLSSINIRGNFQLEYVLPKM